MGPGGGFMAVWASESERQDDLFGRLYDPAGEPLGGEFVVNSYTAAFQFEPAVASDGAGNFVVVWVSDQQDGDSGGIFGRRFDAAGRPVGEEFQVNTYTTDTQDHPAVAAQADGGFLVVWESWRQDGNDNGIFGQRYDAAGKPVGGEFQVNGTTANSQRGPAVAVQPAGEFVVAWQEAAPGSWSLFARRLDADGNPLGPEFEVDASGDYQVDPKVVAGGDGSFVVVWDSLNPEGGRSSTSRVGASTQAEGPWVQSFWSTST